MVKKLEAENTALVHIEMLRQKLTAGLTQKREAFARFMNYILDEDEDMPRVNPKNIDPIRIQEQLLGMPFENVKPRYDDNTLPKETIESMFAQDFTGSSGNVETDNQMVDYIQSTVRASDETDVDQESRNVEAERASVMGDVELQSPVSETPATGQRVDAQQFQALFPDDATGAANSNEKKMSKEALQKIESHEKLCRIMQKQTHDKIHNLERAVSRIEKIMLTSAGVLITGMASVIIVLITQ